MAFHNLAMTPDLADNDKTILAELLREAIERDRFPLSPRVRCQTASTSGPRIGMQKGL
jgi:hypothetical protein